MGLKVCMLLKFIARLSASQLSYDILVLTVLIAVVAVTDKIRSQEISTLWLLTHGLWRNH